jgi:hypothetical protein
MRYTSTIFVSDGKQPRETVRDHPSTSTTVGERVYRGGFGED